MEWKNRALIKIALDQLKDVFLDIPIHGQQSFDDAEKIIQFHSLWYKAIHGPEYGVPKKLTDEWASEALELGDEILTIFQSVLKEWYVLHKYDDPQFMWRKRVEYDALIFEYDSTAFESLGDYIDFKIADTGRFNWVDIETQITPQVAMEIWEYVGYDGNYEFLLNEDEDEETGVSEYQRYVDGDVDLGEQEISERYQQYITNDTREYFRENVDFDAIQYPLFQQLLANCYAKNHDVQVQEWERNKSSSSNGTKGYSFQQITDLAGAQVVRNEQALRSMDLGQIASAISLTLNLKHNFGNLIADHINIDAEVLDELHNKDWTEEEAELRELGQNYSGMFDGSNQKRKPDFELQHDYYKQKDKESYEQRMKKFDDPNQAPEWMRMPMQGAGTVDWKTKFVERRLKREE